ncbi:hypothetical protein [Streptomyces yunnanensis]|uniref:Uncharacterized protein n=1 Tax=Streptomyces yunnanensis TaxID=156453 RepID=A0A9X8N7W9_9ACTN|nr:hypothetical protein [Streptomyces yunnanensis]SHN24632.1 hypothetical protein SAMN05216268_126121 [Streptomyces yunnanensis]
MSKSKAKPSRAFEDKADRMLKAETRQQREAYQLLDEYQDVFSDDALGADEFWDDDEFDDYCEQCHDFHCTVTTWSGERFTVDGCDEEN